jgi:rhodanese-related sulfurtransferase
MTQIPAATPPLKTALTALINGPRELWKRAVNVFRGVRDISPTVALRYAIQNDALVLDVREQKEYDAGHVPQSVLIPLGTLEARVAELDTYRERPIVVICHGGKRSATACAKLAQLGFQDTYNVAGGILAWKKAQLPVEL